MFGNAAPSTMMKQPTIFEIVAQDRPEDWLFRINRANAAVPVITGALKL